MPRSLVTGGAGFLGSHLCDSLIADGHEVICVDNLFTGHRNNVRHLEGNPRFRFVHHDVVEPYEFEVDCIWNFACPAAPGHYRYEPVKTLQTSVDGVLNALNLARRTGARILHTTGGYLTGVAWTHKYVFDLKPEEDVWFCSADVGWITGHSYIVYGPLANGVTSVMYEGAPDYPHKGIWWELCEKSGATVFYTAPTAIRACMKWGSEFPAAHDLSKLRLLGTVGEPINPKAWLWYHEVIGGGRCPIVDTWWQTETAHIMITTLPGAQDAKPGIAGTPLPGIDAAVVDEDGNEVPRGSQGLLVLRRPWPGMLRTLYRDDDRYVDTYWSRLGPETYVVGDAAKMDDEGYVSVIGRIDDVLNVSGHRMSTAEIESAIVSHEVVAEAAVIGQADEDTGQSVAAFVILQGDLVGDDELEAAIREHVAVRIGKLARPKRIIWTDDLPKTRSGKIMRRLLRDIAEGRAVGDVTTLRDPAIMAQLQAHVSGDEG